MLASCSIVNFLTSNYIEVYGISDVVELILLVLNCMICVSCWIYNILQWIHFHCLLLNGSLFTFSKQAFNES